MGADKGEQIEKIGRCPPNSKNSTQNRQRKITKHTNFRSTTISTPQSQLLFIPVQHVVRFITPEIGFSDDNKFILTHSSSVLLSPRAAQPSQQRLSSMTGWRRKAKGVQNRRNPHPDAAHNVSKCRACAKEEPRWAQREIKCC